MRPPGLGCFTAAFPCPLKVVSMGNQINTSTINEQVMTSILNESSEKCSASCTANQTGDVVIIENSTIGGDAGFEVSCSAAASCIMNQSIDTQVQNVLSAIAQQSNASVSGLLGDLGDSGESNQADIDLSIRNFITQMEESTCTASVSFNQSNDLFYASNSSINGFAGFQIGINQPASANASCTMSNLSKIVVYNQAQAQTNQSNTQVSMLALIAIAVVICVLIGGILILMGGRGGGSVIPGPSADTSTALLTALEKNPSLLAI